MTRSELLVLAAVVLIMGHMWVSCAPPKFHEDMILDPSQQKLMADLKNISAAKIGGMTFFKKEIILTKFLKAHLFDVIKSSFAIAGTVEFRTLYQVANLWDERDAEDVKKMIGGNVDFEDAEGRPVLYIRAAKTPLKEAQLLNETHGRILRRAFYTLFEEASRKTLQKFMGGASVTRYVIIADYKGWNELESMCILCTELLIELGRAVEAHWPEFRKKISLINTPPSFDAMMVVFRNVLTPETQKILKIYPMEKDWMPVLANDLGGEDKVKKMIAKGD